ncbi:MAG: hypothetical protein ABEN55_08695 [Bradymonadaceae bacterium]
MCDKTAADYYTAELPNDGTIGLYHGAFIEWIDDEHGAKRCIKEGNHNAPLTAHTSEVWKYGVHDGSGWRLYDTAAEALAEASTLLIPAPSTVLELPDKRGARMAYARLAAAAYSNGYDKDTDTVVDGYDYTAQLAELRGRWNLNSHFYDRAKHAGRMGMESETFEQLAHELIAE